LTSRGQKETKKEKIINAAVRLFSSTHNFNKVSIEDIAREANVSPTTIYNNFGNRDTLIIEILKQIGISAMESYKAIVHADIPFPQKIKLIMQRKVKAAKELDLDVLEKMITQDTRLAEFAVDMNEYEPKPTLLELIEDGKRQGYIEPELSNEAIMMYLELLQTSGTAFFRILEAQHDNEKTLQDFNCVLFYGFLNKDNKEPELARNNYEII